MAIAKKKILYWLKDGVASEAQEEEGRSVGAQFRNAYYAEEGGEDDPIEKCDYVMGDIPESYSRIPVFGSKKRHSSLKDSGDSTDTGTGSNAASGGAQDDEEPEEIEITAEYIGGLLKPDLIQLAQEEEITLTGTEKVDQLKALLLEHFELQE